MAGAACCLATGLHGMVCGSRCRRGAPVQANAQSEWVDSFVYPGTRAPFSHVVRGKVRGLKTVRQRGPTSRGDRCQPVGQRQLL